MRGRTPIVFFGNCQSEVLCAVYNKYVALRTGKEARHIANHAVLSGDDEEAIRGAEILVDQRLEFDSRTEWRDIPNRAQVVEVPLISGGFLWPFGGQAHPASTALKYLAYGPFGPELADGYLNRLYRAGVFAEEAVKRYAELDIHKTINLDRALEVHLERQQRRDEGTGIRIADFIEKNFRREQLFHSPFHLSLPLLKEYASQFLPALGAEPEDIAAMQQRLTRGAHRHLINVSVYLFETPVHPAVSSHFGLQWAPAGRKYRYFGESGLGFEDYVRRYVTFTWNEDLLEGIYLTQHRRDGDAWPKLERGLARDPDSAEGLFCLGLLRFRRNDADGAAEAFRSAADLDDDPQYPAALGDLLSRTGAVERAADWYRRALALDPGNAEYALKLTDTLNSRTQAAAAQHAAFGERCPEAGAPEAGAPEAAKLVNYPTPHATPQSVAVAKKRNRRKPRHDAQLGTPGAGEPGVEMAPVPAGVQSGQTLEDVTTAIRLRDAGDFDEADRILSRACEEATQNPIPAVEYARVAEARKDWAEAQTRWRMVRDKFGRHDAYIGGVAALRQLGDHPAADKLVTEALERFPGHSWFLVQQAQRAAERREWPAAEQAWRTCLAADPAGAWWMHSELARALAEQGHIDQAEEALERGEELHPREPGFLIARARLAERQNKPKKALENWHQLRTRFPANPWGYFGGARALISAGRAAAAEPILADALERFPEDQGIATTWAESAAQQEHWGAAVERWARVRRNFPKNVAGYVAGAVALRAGGQIDQAEALLKEAQRLFSDHEGPFVEHAWLVHARRDWRREAECWELVRTKFPHHATAFTRGAVALREGGRPADAEELLNVAVERFPDDAWGFIEHALAAQNRGDTDATLRRWGELRRRFPDNPWGYGAGWRVLLETGEHVTAEAVLTEGVQRFPHDRGISAGWAELAEAQRDWGSASERWRITRERFPDDPAGYLGGLRVAFASGGAETFEELLAQARRRLSDDSGVLKAAGDLAHSHRDFALALSCGEQLRERFPGKSEGWFLTARALRDTGRVADVETLLHDAAKRFPGNLPILSIWASLPRVRGDVIEAQRRARFLVDRFPEEPSTHTHAVRSCLMARQFEEAATLLRAARERFPDDAGLADAVGELFVARGEWDVARQHWQECLERWPDQSWPHLKHAQTLRAMQLPEQTEAVLQHAATLFPKDTGILFELARAAEYLDRWQVALDRWHWAASLFPTHQSPIIGCGLALRRLGRLEEAAETFAEAMSRFPNEPSAFEHRAHTLAELGRLDEAREVVERAMALFPGERVPFSAYASFALRRDDPAAAFRCLTDALERFPNDPDLTRLLFETQLRLADLDAEGGKVGSAGEAASARRLDRRPAGTVIRVPRENAATLQIRELLMCFESLGGAGHGCEFGILQRKFGAEPLGLLRWADLPAHSLAESLECKFDGVGSPENTILFVPEGNPPEYWTRDSRYWMAMRTFVATDAVSEAAMRAQVSRRIQFLKRKLIADLEAGNKLFVYKSLFADVSAEELGRIYRALRRYGNNTLLYVRDEDEDHPNGTVELAGSGLLIGYIDHFSHSAEDKPLEFVTESWLQICRRAYELWLSQREAAPSGMKQIISSFESLGGTHLGCEFGIVQRAFGAEPLGLLRWTDVTPEALIAALETRFDGIGNEENTELGVSDSGGAEWVTRDRRYGMAMHTFVSTSTVSRERMYAQACRRLSYLRDKLVADLSDGGKIFVYKLTTRNLTRSELRAIRTAMQLYGKNTLLYVQYADEKHLPGTVEMAEPGLIVGYLERFGASRTGEVLQPATAAWAEICNGAYALWSSAKQPVPEPA